MTAYSRARTSSGLIAFICRVKQSKSRAGVSEVVVPLSVGSVGPIRRRFVGLLYPSQHR
jgi:hypothetical protein